MQEQLYINHQRKLLSKRYILEIKESVHMHMCLCVHVYLCMSLCCHACLYACACFCILACVYACILCLLVGGWIHSWVYVCVCVCVFVYMHVCVYVCMGVKFIRQVITVVLDLVFYFVLRLSHRSVYAILAGLGASEDYPVCFPSHFTTPGITGVHSIACFMWSLGI